MEIKKYKVAGVLFEVTQKKYYFEVIDNNDYRKGDKVLVDTVRGQEIGVITSLPIELDENLLVLPLKPILRKATEEDVLKYNEQQAEAKTAFKVCKEKINHHKLTMKLIGAEFTFDKSKLIFYFTTEGRVDFRELVKDLAAIFKVRIELRQIGVRDEARILGSLGICGKELCCKTFINKFDSVSIKMARDQGIVINPSKISGVCGRLLCCIKYEHEAYSEELRKAPAIGQEVKTSKGIGKVISLNPLNNFLYADIPDKGIHKFAFDEVKYLKKAKKKDEGCNCSENTGCCGKNGEEDNLS